MSEENDLDKIPVYDYLLYIFSNKFFDIFKKLSLICEKYQKIHIFKKKE